MLPLNQSSSKFYMQEKNDWMIIYMSIKILHIYGLRKISKYTTINKQIKGLIPFQVSLNSHCIQSLQLVRVETTQVMIRSFRSDLQNMGIIVDLVWENEMEKSFDSLWWLGLLKWLTLMEHIGEKNPQPQKINEHKGLESDLWAVLTMNKDQNTLCWCNSFKIIKIVATLSPHYKKGREKKKKVIAT